MFGPRALRKYAKFIEFKLIFKEGGGWTRATRVFANIRHV
jgi:hypothetical protein